MYGVLRLSYAETSNAVNELPFEEGSISDRAAGTEPKGLGHGKIYLVQWWGGGGGKFPKSGHSNLIDESPRTTHNILSSIRFWMNATDDLSGCMRLLGCSLK
jgi:hypothetical protein